jgi:hypothetical protein
VASPFLTLAAARYALGLLESWDLPRIADQALDEGEYSPELADVALDRRPVMSTVGPLFERALEQAGLALPAREAAAWTLLRSTMKKVAERELPPVDGLSEVARIHRAVRTSNQRGFLGEEFGIHHFLSFHYGLEDLTERPLEVSFEGKYGNEAVSAVAEAVVAGAVEWVAKHGTPP